MKSVSVLDELLAAKAVILKSAFLVSRLDVEIALEKVERAIAAWKSGDPVWQDEDGNLYVD